MPHSFGRSANCLNSSLIKKRTNPNAVNINRSAVSPTNPSSFKYHVLPFHRDRFLSTSTGPSEIFAGQRNSFHDGDMSRSFKTTLRSPIHRSLIADPRRRSFARNIKIHRAHCLENCSSSSNDVPNVRKIHFKAENANISSSDSVITNSDLSEIDYKKLLRPLRRDRIHEVRNSFPMSISYDAVVDELQFLVNHNKHGHLPTNL